MIPVLLGRDVERGENVHLDTDVLRTHMHLVGATGAGKSTAIKTLLRPLLLQPRERGAFFIIDPIGNLAMDFLRLIAHERYCPQHVRDRLVYVEPANEDVVLPFNPLLHSSEGTRYYQTMRAVDITLRAWDATDVTQQPRLLQWMYKAFCAAAMMELPIAMCRYLIHPGTDEHDAILRRIPGDIASHWAAILKARGSEATRILESTRNRLDPFFESHALRRMFGTARHLFDCERFIRERRIVILNLGKYGRIPGFIANTIGALALNEIVETAARLSTTEGRAVVEPTYVLMDEFQRFVGVDIEEALPTVRQMGLRLILAHQSFQQLEREDVDLTQMIWQARSRLVFANSARDADILADELAKLTFYSKRVKDVRTSLKQLIVGYRKEWLESVSSTDGSSVTDSLQQAIGYKTAAGEAFAPLALGPTRSTSQGHESRQSTGRATGQNRADTRGRSQANVPIHQTIQEVSNITFEPFQEFALKWGQKIRRLATGEAFAIIANDPTIRRIAIDHVPIEETKELQDAVEALKEKNFRSDCFISAAEADREFDACRRRLLQGDPITISSSPAGDEQQKVEDEAPRTSPNSPPFR